MVGRRLQRGRSGKGRSGGSSRSAAAVPEQPAPEPDSSAAEDAVASDESLIGDEDAAAVPDDTCSLPAGSEEEAEETPRTKCQGVAENLKTEAKRATAISFVPPEVPPMLPDATSQELRAALSKLNKNFRTRWRPGGGRGTMQESMTRLEMQTAYTRRVEHAEGARRLHRWATELPGGGLPLRDGIAERAFAFWYDKAGKDTAQLPPVCRDGLASAVAKGGFEVHLLCYQRMEHLPVGVCPIPCEDFLPYAEFRKLLAGAVPLPLLADYIRLKALGGYSAWFIDCDTLWLRQPAVNWDGPCYGHVFGSQEAGGQTLRDNASDSIRRWNIQYLKVPGDRLFIATPYRLPCSSPLLAELVSWFENLFRQVALMADPSSLDYNIAMNKCFELVQRWGLEDACTDPVVFSGVPRWFSKQRCFRSMKKEDRTVLAKIRDSGVAVNVFWQSSRGDGSPTYEDMAPDSLWNSLLSLARTSGASKRRRVTGRALPWPAVPALGQVGFPSMSPPLASELSRKFRLNSQVARGAYGVVYRATNLESNQVVAVKVIVDEQGQCEGRELFFLKHVQGCQFVVTLHDGFTSPFWTAIVTELFRCSLHEYKKTQRRATFDSVMHC